MIRNAPKKVFAVVACVMLIAMPILLMSVFVGSGALLATTDLVGITQTRYAQSYTERAFIAIQIGDTDTDVQDSLGQPLGISTINEDISFTWHYTESSGTAAGYYWKRTITMDSATGKVIAKDAELTLG